MEATWLGVEASFEGTTSAQSEAVTAMGAAAALLLLGDRDEESFSPFHIHVLII